MREKQKARKKRQRQEMQKEIYKYRGKTTSNRDMLGEKQRERKEKRLETPRRYVK